MAVVVAEEEIGHISLLKRLNPSILTSFATSALGHCIWGLGQ